MTHVLIVEDEARIARHIEKHVRAFLGKDLSKLTLCNDLQQAIEAIEESEPDLVLLDLNLKGEDGFSLLDQSLAGSFHTIVISAYRERALEAFEHGVLDFVAKPFSGARLEQALSRFLTTERRTGPPTKFLTVKTPGRTRLIPLEEVVYLKGAGHYAEIHLNNGEQTLHGKSLERLLVLLPDHFIRIHKSYIVNLNFAQEIRSSPGSIYELILKNEAVLPIGRTRLTELREYFA